VNDRKSREVMVYILTCGRLQSLTWAVIISEGGSPKYQLNQPLLVFDYHDFKAFTYRA
jgi:hypothetical protein